MYIERPSLSASELRDIKQLVGLCNAAEAIELKFNWDMMAQRDGQAISDILAYDGDTLIGCVPIDGFGDFAEITLAVHPQYRRRGIGRELYTRARQACSQQGVQRLLLVSVNGAQAGADFIQALGLPYAFSEYRMTLQGQPAAVSVPEGLVLRPANARDIPDLVRIFAECFGRQEGAQAYVQRSMSEAGSEIDIALLHGQAVGQIGVSRSDRGAYIRGVAVQPASQGRGYGRSILTQTVLGLLEAGETHQTLDVETQNSNALGLYEGCGFRQVNGFHYYNVEC